MAFSSILPAIGSRLRSSSRSASNPAAAVWYVESRAVNEHGPAPDEAVRGSGVVVRLEQLRRTDDGAQWEPSQPPEFKKYLLTCAHVVRGFHQSSAGWNPLLGEILCWRQGSHFQHWQYSERLRFSGESKQIGAHRAHVALSPHPQTGMVPSAEARPSTDWVLLEVDDGPSGLFADAPAVDRWRQLDAEDESPLALAVVGYPGGAISWKHNDKVTPHRAEPFRLKRGDGQGGLILSGQDTRPGMSGGGVFDPDGALVGIHRAVTDAALERHVVAAGQIRSWLEENGLRPAPPIAPRGGGWTGWWTIVPGVLLIGALVFWFIQPGERRELRVLHAVVDYPTVERLPLPDETVPPPTGGDGPPAFDLRVRLDSGESYQWPGLRRNGVYVGAAVEDLHWFVKQQALSSVEREAMQRRLGSLKEELGWLIEEWQADPQLLASRKLDADASVVFELFEHSTGSKEACAKATVAAAPGVQVVFLDPESCN